MQSLYAHSQSVEMYTKLLSQNKTIRDYLFIQIEILQSEGGMNTLQEMYERLLRLKF